MNNRTAVEKLKKKTKSSIQELIITERSQYLGPYSLKDF